MNRRPSTLTDPQMCARYRSGVTIAQVAREAGQTVISTTKILRAGIGKAEFLAIGRANRSRAKLGKSPTRRIKPTEAQPLAERSIPSEPDTSHLSEGRRRSAAFVRHLDRLHVEGEIAW